MDHNPFHIVRIALSLSKHESDEVAFFSRGAFPAQDVSAVSPKPLFGLLLIGIPLRVCRDRHRVNVLSGSGLANISWVLRVADSARGGVGLAARRIGPEERLAALAENPPNAESVAFAWFA
jgi:hypothetical protein